MLELKNVKMTTKGHSGVTQREFLSDYSDKKYQNGSSASRTWHKIKKL